MKVACLDLEDALAAFLEWLEVCIQSILERKKSTSFNQELGGDVVLVAHKCLDYDAKVEIILKYRSSPSNKDCINYSIFNRCSCAIWKNSTFHTVISSG